MANPEHLEILKQGVEVWNRWRKENPEIRPDLSNAELERAVLRGVNFRRANLFQTDFWKADLAEAKLNWADCRQANLRKANLFEAKLIGANLKGANLTGTLLVDAWLQCADLSGCFIYGCSVWNVRLKRTTQSDLIIADAPLGKWKSGDLSDTGLRIDNLEVAQFVYLLLQNEKIRDVIDTVVKKAVLILGRFTPQRKAVLEAIRNKLRERNYIPILFDFEKPSSRDLTETVSTLAHMARFIVADITEAKSIPQELERIIPDLPSVPVQPIKDSSDSEFAMFEHFRRYPWVLKLYEYDDLHELLDSLEEKVIAPAEAAINAMR